MRKPQSTSDVGVLVCSSPRAARTILWVEKAGQWSSRLPHLWAPSHSPWSFLPHSSQAQCILWSPLLSPERWSTDSATCCVLPWCVLQRWQSYCQTCLFPSLKKRQKALSPNWAAWYRKVNTEKAVVSLLPLQSWVCQPNKYTQFHIIAGKHRLWVWATWVWITPLSLANCYLICMCLGCLVGE